jgi:hypothetical protein
LTGAFALVGSIPEHSDFVTPGESINDLSRVGHNRPLGQAIDEAPGGSFAPRLLHCPVDMTLGDIGGLFDGIEPEAPEPATALDDDGAPEVGGDLLTPGESVNEAPLDSAALTVDVDDFFEPGPDPPPLPVDRLDGTALATENMVDLSQSPPAPEAKASVTPPEAVALDEPPTIEGPRPSDAPPAPPESSFMLLAADLRRLAAELGDFSADAS